LKHCKKGLAAIGIGVLILIALFCPPQVMLVLSAVAFIVLGISCLRSF